MGDEGTRPLLRELPSLAVLAQVISLRAALMPDMALALNKMPRQPILLGIFTKKMTQHTGTAPDRGKGRGIAVKTAEVLLLAPLEAATNGL